MSLELLRSYQDPKFAAAFHMVLALPSGLTPEEIERRLDGKMESLYVLLTTLESLGVLVFRREVSLDLVDDYLSGLIRIAWEKLGPYVEHLRASEGRDTLGEWVQWLHDRMVERERASVPVPAHVAHRSWQPR